MSYDESPAETLIPIHKTTDRSGVLVVVVNYEKLAKLRSRQEILE